MVKIAPKNEQKRGNGNNLQKRPPKKQTKSGQNIHIALHETQLLTPEITTLPASPLGPLSTLPLPPGSAEIKKNGLVCGGDSFRRPERAGWGWAQAAEDTQPAARNVTSPALGRRGGGIPGGDSWNSDCAGINDTDTPIGPHLTPHPPTQTRCQTCIHTDGSTLRIMRRTPAVQKKTQIGYCFFLFVMKCNTTTTHTPPTVQNMAKFQE